MHATPEHNTDQRIRMKAYEIWLLEGQPEGREARHWEMAKELIAREETRNTLLSLDAHAADTMDNTSADALEREKDTMRAPPKSRRQGGNGV